MLTPLIFDARACALGGSSTVGQVMNVTARSTNARTCGWRVWMSW